MAKRSGVVLVVVVCWLMSQRSGTAQTVPYFPVTATEGELLAEQRIRQQLLQRMDFDFADAPLSEVVAWLDRQGLPVQLDARALEEIGRSPRDTIRFRAAGIQLRSALALMLDPLDLTWSIRHEQLLITSPENAENAVKTRVFDLTRLMPKYPATYRTGEASWTTMNYDFDTLIDLITSTTAVDSWDEFGGVGAIEGVELHGAALLIVSQTDPILDQVTGLLNRLQQAASPYLRAAAPIRSSALRPVVPGTRGRLSSVSIDPGPRGATRWGPARAPAPRMDGRVYSSGGLF